MTQKQKVLRHMTLNNHITPLEAMGLYGIFRLAARIFELRASGIEIDTNVVTSPTGLPYARYSLIS
jgi:hypothetical protein